MAKKGEYRFEIRLSLNNPEEYELYRILTNKPENYRTLKQYYIDILKAGISHTQSEETDSSLIESAKEAAREAAILETRKILQPLFSGYDMNNDKKEQTTSYESEDILPSSRMTSIVDHWG